MSFFRILQLNVTLSGQIYFLASSLSRVYFSHNLQMHFFLIPAWAGNFSWLKAFISVPRRDLGGILDSELPILGLFFPSSVARLQGSFSWVLCNPWIYSALRGEGTFQRAVCCPEFSVKWLGRTLSTKINQSTGPPFLIWTLFSDFSRLSRGELHAFLLSITSPLTFSLSQQKVLHSGQASCFLQPIGHCPLGLAIALGAASKGTEDAGSSCGREIFLSARTHTPTLSLPECSEN